MEARQLAYFVFACQHRNHTEAARLLQVPASVLSDNLRLLEKGLETSLFQRGPSGLYPTEAARWLYQSVEPVLRALEDGEEVLRAGQFVPSRKLKVTSPLRFLMGRLSRATSLAARALRKADPDVLVTIDFAATIGGYSDGEGPIGDRRVASVNEDSLAGEVLITHGYDLKDPSAVMLLEDRWLCVAPLDRMTRVGETVDFEALRKTPLYIPALRSPQIRRLREYCAEQKLPEPVIFDDDVGTLPRLSRSAERFHLLVPEAMISDSLERLNLGYMVLPEEIKSPIVAMVPKESPTAWRYVELLKEAVRSEEPILCYDPRVTLKQARYFLSVCKELSISAAARQLGVAQPAVSAQIKKIEATSSEKLFERHRAGLELTSRAKTLQRVLQPAISTLDVVSLKAPYLIAGRMRQLTIGLIPAGSHLGALEGAVTDALGEWRRSYSTVDLRVLEGPKGALYRWVEAGKIGLALAEADYARRQHPAAERSRLGLVTISDLSLPKGADIEFRKAVRMPLILPDDTGGLRQILQAAAAEAHIRLAPFIEVNSLPITLKLLKQEGLATVLPYHVAEPYLMDGSFQFRKLVNPEICQRLTFLHSAARELTEIEKALISAIRANLRQAGIACD